jgi:acetyltransferase
VLHLWTPETVTEAARRLGGPVLVARQIEGAREAFCGVTRDPTFGPVVVVGRGGADVEMRADVVACLAPIGLEIAVELVREAELDDPDGTVARALAAISQLAVTHPEIESIDVNPLVVSENGTIAVDALVVVTD